MEGKIRFYKIIIFLLAVLIIVAAVAYGVLLSVNESSIENQSLVDVNEIAKGNSDFALQLYSKLAAEKENENFFFSPYSISTALSMTYAGAKGNTEKQMADVLHFTLPQEQLHLAFGSLEKQLTERAKKGGYELNIANALWGQKGEPFLKDFLELIKKYYGGGLTQLDFSSPQAAEEARNIINAWVEKETKDKIKELIAKRQVDGAILVLTNAIYFKGRWAIEFDKKETKDSPFHITTSKDVTVPMMYLKEDFKYTEADNLQILELPYKGEDLSMIVLLPKEIDGIGKLEKLLTIENLERWLTNLKKQEVGVYLPRFKIVWGTFNLAKILEEMGMPDAFSPAADFSGITKAPLFITLVLHKAFVEVNEEGTEAAAATAVVMMKSAILQPTVFQADHPFIFLIKDNKTSSILFMGKVMNPVEK